jgi:hypothetical protein
MILSECGKTGEWPAFIPALMMAHNTGVHKGTKSSPFEAMFGYSPNTVHWPNMEDIVHAPQEDLTSQDAITRLQNNRSEIRDAAKDALYLQQSQMLRANDNARVPGTKQWRPMPKEKVWVRKKETNVPNPKLVEKVEPGIIIRCTRPDVYEVSRTNRRKAKSITVNIDLLRPKISDVPEDDPNLIDIAEEPPQEPLTEEQISVIRQNVMEQINAMHIILTESALATFEEEMDYWRKRNIPCSLSFTQPQPAQTAAPPLPAPTAPTARQAPGPAQAPRAPRATETTPPPTTTGATGPPAPPRKPTTPPRSEDRTTSTRDSTEMSSDEEFFDAVTSPAAPSPKPHPSLRASFKNSRRLVRDVKNIIGNEVLKIRTRSQRKS